MPCLLRITIALFHPYPYLEEHWGTPQTPAMGSTPATLLKNVL